MKKETIFETASFITEIFDDFLLARKIDVPTSTAEMKENHTTRTECGSALYGTDFGEIADKVEAELNRFKANVEKAKDEETKPKTIKLILTPSDVGRIIEALDSRYEDHELLYEDAEYGITVTKEEAREHYEEMQYLHDLRRQITCCYMTQTIGGNNDQKH